MLTHSKTRLVGGSLCALLLISGCSGDDPAPSPSPTATVTATSTPEATATPKAPKTPAPHISPLGGKPATEEEKQYHNLTKKAEKMVLSKNYKEAIPLLKQAAEQRPKDVENIFYLMLSHGSLELVPTKGSAAYPYAQKVVEMDPTSTEAERARTYLAAAELDIPKDFKFGKETIASLGGFVFDNETLYKLKTDAPLHVELGPRIGRKDKDTLWEAEVAPEMHKDTLTLKAGTEVGILSESHFFYSLTGWRIPLRGEPREMSDSIFELNAFYVEVTSDGDTKGKKGWIVNQVDRYLDKDRPDPWGVWIPDRFGLPRQETTKP